jgi:hypothetical protein
MFIKINSHMLFPMKDNILVGESHRPRLVTAELGAQPPFGGYVPAA